VIAPDSGKPRGQERKTSEQIQVSEDFLLLAGIAVAAAVASPIGGFAALWSKPSTLFMSGSLGFASGVLLATIAFEMMPNSVELSSLPIAMGGFVLGFAAVYAFDLFIHRGVLVGEKAEQYARLERFHRRPRDGKVTVLAGGTSAEELIEGLSIGVGFAIKPGLGLFVALAILIDNFSEALSIGEIIRNEKDDRGRSGPRRILGWTGLIGASLLISSLVGWLFLRGMAQPVLGALFGAGAGGMFYLTVTNLVPQAEERQYQQVPAITMGCGFILIFALSILS
jgi:zinc transporter, ZIP family